MLTVAWNIGSGDGITYTYNENTTGVQPLATILFALMARAAQEVGAYKWEYLRFIIVIGGLTACILSYLMGSLARRAWRSEKRKAETAALLATALSALSFSIFRHSTYGLETGLYLTLIISCMLYTSHIAETDATRGFPQAVGLGIALGLTALARIDFCIPAILVLSALVPQRLTTFRLAATTALVATIITVPWIVYVAKIIGSPIPSSGGAQMETISASNAVYRTMAFLESLLECITPWLPIRGKAASLALSVAISGAAMLFLRKEWQGNAGARTEKPWLRNAGIWALSLLPLALIYPTFFGQPTSTLDTWLRFIP